eukprot:5797183-Prymnesium_polylepis.1
MQTRRQSPISGKSADPPSSLPADVHCDRRSSQQADVVLVYSVPFLNPQLLWPCADLGGEQLLQVAYGVLRIAFDPDLLTEAVVADDLDHGGAFPASGTQVPAF